MNITFKNPPLCTLRKQPPHRDELSSTPVTASFVFSSSKQRISTLYSSTVSSFPAPANSWIRRFRRQELTLTFCLKCTMFVISYSSCTSGEYRPFDSCCMSYRHVKHKFVSSHFCVGEAGLRMVNLVWNDFRTYPSSAKKRFRITVFTVHVSCPGNHSIIYLQIKPACHNKAGLWAAFSADPLPSYRFDAT